MKNLYNWGFVMIYGYIAVLGLYLLLFILSRREKVSAYRNRTEKKSYPGEVFFLRAAAWYIRQKEQLSRRLTRRMPDRGRRYKEQSDKKQLGRKLRLLHPEVSESHQVREFYIRQYSLVLLALFVGNLLSLGAALYVRADRRVQEGGYINRKAYGQGDTEVALLAQIEGEEAEEIFYTVEEQKYKPDEITSLFQEASVKLPEAILGGNSSLDGVTEDLELVTSMDGYPFQIAWESSSYSLIRTDGTVLNEALQDAAVVMLTAYFSYEETTFEEVFPVQLQPAVFSEEELLIQSIRDSLDKQDLASRTDDSMRLPDRIGAKNVFWKEMIQDNSGYIFLLMCLAAALVFWSKKNEVEEKLRKRDRELLLDYPEIVNKLTLYMGAGMTIRNAFRKMGEDYKKQEVSGGRRYVYEEIVLLCHELQSGISETEAYAHLGKRCRLQPYMKLSTLLSQNLRKGSNDLLMMLRQETAAAFEQRKNAAKKAGEEAGTRLLAPMMMMLCIVMVLIMIPAYFSL